MNDAIRDDVEAQVAAFVLRARAVFDTGGYPHLVDGPEFDAALAALNGEFNALQRVFHDYLLATWSEEAAAALRGATAPNAANRVSGSGKGHAP